MYLVWETSFALTVSDTLLFLLAFVLLPPRHYEKDSMLQKNCHYLGQYMAVTGILTQLFVIRVLVKISPTNCSCVVVVRGCSDAYATSFIR